MSQGVVIFGVVTYHTGLSSFVCLVLYNSKLEHAFEYKKVKSGLAHHVVGVLKSISTLSDMEGNNGRHYSCATSPLRPGQRAGSVPIRCSFLHQRHAHTNRGSYRILDLGFLRRIANSAG